MTVLVGLAVVSAFGVMVWKAAHAEGYVIESFEVPPDLAARGLTGEVASARLLDRLNVVQTPGPNNVGAAQALSTNASDTVKVEIPETGISLGEIYRFLRRWLGSEIHVSGEVVRQDKDLAVTVRINGTNGATWQGPEADFDALIQKAGEHVYEVSQPARYGAYLGGQSPPRIAEQRAVYQRVIDDPASQPRQRAASLNGLANLARSVGDFQEAQALYRRARETDPTYALGYTNSVLHEFNLGHPEAALALLPEAQAKLEKYTDYWSASAVAQTRIGLRTTDAQIRGDFASSVSQSQIAAANDSGPRQYNDFIAIAWNRGRLHDRGANAWLAEQPRPVTIPASLNATILSRSYQIETALQHWPRVIALTAELEKILAGDSFSRTGRETVTAIQVRPWTALAKSKTGEIASAESLIAMTPGDCYDCIRIRGMIASEAKVWGRADYWFAKAVADAPSIPFAREDSGRSLLSRGKPDDAIVQFTIANQKGPHFADALEGWGEALMAKNQSHLALAKFAEAEKYAPNWGRLHLKWGEALVYAGKRDEAKAQFARAAQLDLTPSEKAELQKVAHV